MKKERDHEGWRQGSCSVRCHEGRAHERGHVHVHERK
jgi:hypothetical protein